MAPTMAEASMIADIIAGVNKKVGEDNDDVAELDEEIGLTTNRGNKLKRKAIYAHEGQLYGKRTFKKKITHAGYDRYILSRRVKRFDAEGYPLETDEEDAEADADAADRDAYHGVDVQGLLMPLTAASELWKHPGMSNAYTNNMLPDMAQRANDMLRREKSLLYLVKELATKFRGDHTFIQCGDFFKESDKDLFDVEPVIRSIRAQILGHDTEKETPEAAIEVNIVSAENLGTNGAKEDGTQAEDISMVEGNAAPPSTLEGAAEALASTAERPGNPEGRGINGASNPPVGISEVKQESGANIATSELDAEGKNGVNGGTPLREKDDNEDEMQEESPVPRMVTRGAAAAANGHGVSTSQAGDESNKPARSPSLQASIPPVHALFIPPVGSIPDRNFGIPQVEAEDIRKLLNVFIQKQEEVVRGCERIYELFLKANRLRNTVYRWSRAEGHVGEMSDEEEWVDQEEWGLDGPLRKGAAEGEEEVSDDRRGKGRRRGAA